MRVAGLVRQRQLTREVLAARRFDHLPGRSRGETGLVGKEIRVRHECSIGTLGERLEETLPDRDARRMPASLPPGRMPEWTNGTVSNTVEVLWVSVGSNPTPSARSADVASRHSQRRPSAGRWPTGSTR